MSYLSNLLPYLPSLSGKQVLQANPCAITTRVLNEQLVESVTVLNAKQQQTESSTTSSNVIYLENDIASFNNSSKFDLIYAVDLKLVDLESESLLNVVDKSLSTLSSNGLFLVVESFSSGNMTPIDFISLIQSKIVELNAAQYGYDLVFAKPDANNNNQMSFLFTKIVLENHHGFKTLKEFMDHKQYTRNGVLRYEKIFGAGFVSTGGIDTTTQFLAELDLKPGQRVLDVGCGIGGGDFLMAEKYGVSVTGIDLSSNMIGIAWDRATQHSNLNVKFEISDATKNKFPNEYFDLIYSRDTLLHVKDKQSLFALFKQWLKPNGKVFITDYCCGPKPWSDEFTTYVDQRGYNLLTVPEYGKLFEDLNFSKVVATDVTNMFVDCLNNELDKFEKMKQDFVEEFSAEDFNYLIDGWKAKKVRCAEGHQRWGKFYCEK